MLKATMERQSVIVENKDVTQLKENQRTGKTEPKQAAREDQTKMDEEPIEEEIHTLKDSPRKSNKERQGRKSGDNVETSTERQENKEEEIIDSLQCQENINIGRERNEKQGSHTKPNLRNLTEDREPKAFRAPHNRTEDLRNTEENRKQITQQHIGYRGQKPTLVEDLHARQTDNNPKPINARDREPNNEEEQTWRPVTRGRKGGNNIIQAIESKIWLHVSRLKTDTREGQLVEYLRKNGVKGDISCQELGNRLNDKAFKIGVPTQYETLIYSEDFWPTGIRFRKFRAPWKYRGPYDGRY